MTPSELAILDVARSALDWDRAGMLRAARRVAKFAPQYQYEASVAGFLLPLNRPREAIELLERAQFAFDPDEYGMPWEGLDWMAKAQHMVDDYGRELEYANLGLRHYPTEARFFDSKSRALAALGEIESLDGVIEEFLRSQTQGTSAGELMSWKARENASQAS